jgi:hypothetical protein
MGVTSPGRRFWSGLSLGICLLAISAPGHRLKADAEEDTGTFEKLSVASGVAALEVDLQRLGPGDAGATRTRPTVLRFDLDRDSFLAVLVFNGELRGPLPGSVRLIPLGSPALPRSLASRDLLIEQAAWGAPFDLVVRDAATGLALFNVEGHEYAYESAERSLSVRAGRLLVSKEFAAELGRPTGAGALVGSLSIDATMRPIEVTKIVDGELREDSLPGLAGGVPGPDVIVGDVNGLAQFGSQSGTQVGLALGTDSCNAGQVDLNWFALPSNDHPVIPQNLYRMSGGPRNDQRFEQIGQSSVKHAFTALTQNLCGFGCNGVGGSRLGSGCSDPYSASLNSGPSLGSRAWINPFTGAYPRGDAATPPNIHTGHAHQGPSHRILTEVNDLNTALNPGATYYSEGQYVTPHEYAWCQTHPGECNMNNNVSYRRYNVSGTASPFSFSPVGSTVRMQPAIRAWTGATLAQFKPSTDDGVGIVGFKVTHPSPEVWRYEYAIYNQNLDRGIQSFSVPKRPGVILSNVGFHAPPQHPGWAADGTVASAGYSSAPWAQTEAGGLVTWSSETMADNPNANAIRWGTLYNIRFDANTGPILTSATIGFFKTGTPMDVQVVAPRHCFRSCSGK